MTTFNSQFSIRSILSLDENENTNNQTSNNEERPPFTYSALILMALRSDSEKRLTFQEICDWISTKFPYYKKNNTKTWYNAIRQNLSLNTCFVCLHSFECPGRGNYWTLNSSAESVKIVGSTGRLLKRKIYKDSRPYCPPTKRQRNEIDIPFKLQIQQNSNKLFCKPTPDPAVNKTHNISNIDQQSIKIEQGYLTIGNNSPTPDHMRLKEQTSTSTLHYQHNETYEQLGNHLISSHQLQNTSKAEYKACESNYIGSKFQKNVLDTPIPEFSTNGIYLPTPAQMMSIWNYVYQYQKHMAESQK